MPEATPEQEAWTKGYDAAKAAMQPGLDTIKRWIDNLLTNAATYRQRAAEAPSYAGNGLSAAYWKAQVADCEARASDFQDVLALFTNERTN